MLHKRASLGTRKVSPPQPTCMTDDQKATYLANLRNNRPARPGGARPLPGRPTIPNPENVQSLPRSGSALSFREEERIDAGGKRNSMIHSNSMPSVGALKGRPLVHAPAALRGGEGPSISTQQPGQLRFRETTSRETERQEAHSLRQALDQIDHASDDDTRVFEAAQKEAADLVWRHLNPRLAENEKTSAYRNPDLRKRETQAGSNREAITTQITRTEMHKSLPEGMVADEDCKVEGLRLSKRGSRDWNNKQQAVSASSNRRRSSGKRTVSNGSSKGVFRNPDDQIYEEPEEIENSAKSKAPMQELPLRTRAGNPVLRGSRPLPEKTTSVPLPERLRFDRFEIHRNPRTQSRNADYTYNPPSREATPETETPKGRALEIRSDEIRAATSMRRKDRSPKLPNPSAVSDRPGRPIVSFDPGWRPLHESPKNSLDVERPSPRSVAPPITTSHSAPSIPTINLPDDDVPTINISDADSSVPSISDSVAPSVPTITLPEEDSTHAMPTINVSDETTIRPLPQINVISSSKPASRPLPSHSQSSPAKLPPNGSARTNRVPWLSRGPMAAAGTTVTCNACQLPISGRIVTASGSSPSGPKVRFHPECFSCHHCSTALECVSFYPEPAASRDERVQSDAEADPAEMRFYCHLDYHDLFSPRCASCKTPIEGAVVLAAGKSWHEGHFFCAECGDPFSSTSPFVEDKGYAYCVGCHTKRTSARCRGCKKQILDEVSVEALGGKWHEECFRCDECAGDFGEEGRFFVREVEIELTEKEKRKGVVAKKFEERAVCAGCEALRLRRVDAFL